MLLLQNETKQIIADLSAKSLLFRALFCTNKVRPGERIHIQYKLEILHDNVKSNTYI